LTCENQINIKSKSNKTIVLGPFPALCLALMRTMVDDLPCVSVSRIRPDDTPPPALLSSLAFSTSVFPRAAAGVFSSAPAAGGAALFGCSRARRRARAVVEDLTKPERAAYVASWLKARLLSEVPARSILRRGMILRI
jgi:hypothetical protein